MATNSAVPHGLEKLTQQLKHSLWGETTLLPRLQPPEHALQPALATEASPHATGRRYNVLLQCDFWLLKYHRLAQFELFPQFIGGIRKQNTAQIQAKSISGAARRRLIGSVPRQDRPDRSIEQVAQPDADRVFLDANEAREGGEGRRQRGRQDGGQRRVIKSNYDRDFGRSLANEPRAFRPRLVTKWSAGSGSRGPISTLRQGRPRARRPTA